jgi:hypothetical protein
MGGDRSFGSALRRLFSYVVSPPPTGSPGNPGQVPPDGGGPPLRDWPVPPAVSIAASPFVVPPAIHYSARRADIRVFTYPFDQPELSGFARPTMLPVASSAPDGKFCEFATEQGTARYFPCHELIETLRQHEASSGKGLARLRWIALDHFDYRAEADALYREFEAERGALMTATGLARISLERRPARALELLRNAQQRGISGAAMMACEARALIACGLIPEGLRAAAQALRARPDPHWMPADHFHAWGVLHGAALAAQRDAALRESLRRAVATIAAPDATAETLLACRWLYGTADDPTSMACETDNSTPDTGEADEVAMSEGPAFAGPDVSDVPGVRGYCRRIAESHNAGLVEAGVVTTREGRAIQMIYKQRRGSGFSFTGTQQLPLAGSTRTWSVTCAEGSTTGVREAVITSLLMGQGRLTVESYRTSWARDPYDSAYQGPDRSTLRYISDGEEYDAIFPAHPLSRVRRVLRRLAASE